MINLKKNTLILFIVIVLTLFLFVYLFSNRKKEVKKIEKDQNEAILVPTVDNNVKIYLEKIKVGEIKVIIDNAPEKTKNIDFEISYLVKNNDIDEGVENELISQGAMGMCYLEDNLWYCGTGQGINKKIVLGTCSSGVCRYHNIVGPIKLNLKFSGSYGEKVFEKEYQL